LQILPARITTQTGTLIPAQITMQKNSIVNIARKALNLNDFLILVYSTVLKKSLNCARERLVLWRAWCKKF